MRDKIKLESTAGTGRYTATKNKADHARQDGNQKVRPVAHQARDLQNQAGSNSARLPLLLKTLMHCVGSREICCCNAAMPPLTGGRPVADRRPRQHTCRTRHGARHPTDAARPMQPALALPAKGAAATGGHGASSPLDIFIMEAFCSPPAFVAPGRNRRQDPTACLLLAARFKRPIPIIAGIFCRHPCSTPCSGGRPGQLADRAHAGRHHAAGCWASFSCHMAVWLLIPVPSTTKTPTARDKLGVFAATVIAFSDRRWATRRKSPPWRWPRVLTA